MVAIGGFYSRLQESLTAMGKKESYLEAVRIVGGIDISSLGDSISDRAGPKPVDENRVTVISS